MKITLDITKEQAEAIYQNIVSASQSNSNAITKAKDTDNALALHLEKKRDMYWNVIRQFNAQGIDHSVGGSWD